MRWLVALLLMVSSAGAQSPLQDAARLDALGWTVIAPGMGEVVHWYSSEGTVAWPLSMSHVVVRCEFAVPVYFGGSLMPEPRFDMMAPPDAVWGRVWWSPVLVGGEQLSFGREVDLLTGEITDDMHYGEQPGDWFMGVDE